MQSIDELKNARRLSQTPIYTCSLLAWLQVTGVWIAVKKISEIRQA